MIDLNEEKVDIPITKSTDNQNKIIPIINIKRENEINLNKENEIKQIKGILKKDNNSDIKNLYYHPLFSNEIYYGNFLNDPYTFMDEEHEATEEYLIFIVHGMGQNKQKLERILNLRIKETIKKIYHKKKFFKKRIHLRMIDWKTGLFEKTKNQLSLLLDDNNTTHYPKQFIQQVPLDVLFYLNYNNKFEIINDIIKQMNNYFQLVKHFRNKFQGGVSVISHSLGSVIMYDILKNLTFNEEKEFEEEIISEKSVASPRKSFCENHILESSLNISKLSDLIIDKSNSDSFEIKKNIALSEGNLLEERVSINQTSFINNSVIYTNNSISNRKSKRHFSNIENKLRRESMKILLGTEDLQKEISEMADESDLIKLIKINRNERKNYENNINLKENIINKEIDIFSAEIILENKANLKNEKSKLNSNMNKNVFSNQNFNSEKSNHSMKLFNNFGIFANKKIFSRQKEMNPLFFGIDHFFLFGSPLSLFLTIHNPDDNYLEEMETVNDFHNIIHPMDPVAYRIEPVIKDFPRSQHSFSLPHWENDSIKTGFCYSFIDIFFKKYKTTDEKPALFDDKIHRKRYDFICQEKLAEKVFNIVGFLFSHMAYWDNFDIFYFIIKLIHWQEYNILKN